MLFIYVFLVTERLLSTTMRFPFYLHFLTHKVRSYKEVLCVGLLAVTSFLRHQKLYFNSTTPQTVMKNVRNFLYPPYFSDILIYCCEHIYLYFLHALVKYFLHYIFSTLERQIKYCYFLIYTLD